MTSRLSVTPFPPELVWAMVAGVGGNAPVVDMGYLPLSSPSCGVFTSISAVVSSAALWPSTDWRTLFWLVPRSAWPELSGRRNARNCCSCRSHVIGVLGFCAIFSVVFHEDLIVARLCASWIVSISRRH
jgi:hypothetical protein